MLNPLLAFAAAVIVICFAIWLLRRAARDQGKAEAESDLHKRMVENAETTGRIVAEHREPGDVSKRMRDGSF